MRAIYMVPIAGIVMGGVGVIALMRRWRANEDKVPEKQPTRSKGDMPASAKKDDDQPKTQDEYDARLDDALRDLDD